MKTFSKLNLCFLLLVLSSCGGGSSSNDTLADNEGTATTLEDVNSVETLEERLADLNLDGTADDAVFRELAVVPPSFTTSTLNSSMSEEDALRLKVGKDVNAFYVLVPQQCAAVKSPFDLVRDSTGKAPEIISDTTFRNWEGDKTAGAKLRGDLIIFSETSRETLVNNYDQIISANGATCEVIDYSYETEEPNTVECFTFNPELIWDYSCASGKFIDYYEENRNFLTSINYEEPADINGDTYPAVGFLSYQQSGDGFLIKTSIYFYSNDLNTVANLNYAMFVDDEKESDSVISAYPQINAEMIRLVQEALHNI